ncbi:MAG: amidohydrolase, imidazolonepropionase [Bacteroidetes bacterium]|nr:amidohydrolase, imidazolonepropionase [Bacteroidota bacterium]
MIKKLRVHLILVALISVANCPLSIAQSDVPVPAPKQTERICLKGGTVHIGNGTVIENAYVLFENGKVTDVFAATTIKTDATLGRIIDVTGKQIYPGVIAPNTVLGLSEIEAVRATNDQGEVGAINPDVRAVISYNTDSRVTPTVRSNGVLYAQVVPQGGRVSGTSSVVQLDAWNWEDAAVKADEGLFITWPNMYKVKGWWAEPEGYELNKEYDKGVQDLKDYFNEAKSYAYSTHEKKNLRFESMRKLFTDKENLYVRVDYVKEILNVITFAEEMGVNVVLIGGADSYMIADVLAQKKIPVILGRSHELPSYNDEDIQQPYKTPAILQKAGVLYALSINGFWQQRNLMFQAGTASAYGLSKEEALASITSNTAKILKLDDKIGTIEKGKAASFIISDGDLLDMRSSNISQAFIDGREINLDNKQKELYKKFSDKYFKK